MAYFEKDGHFFEIQDVEKDYSDMSAGAQALLVYRQGKIGEIGEAKAEILPNGEANQKWFDMIESKEKEGFVKIKTAGKLDIMHDVEMAMRPEGKLGIQAVEEMLKKYRHSEYAYKVIGVKYLDEMDDPQKAEEYFRKALLVNPAYESAYYNLACLFARKKDKASMLENLSLAIKFDEVTGKTNNYRVMAREDADFKEYLTDPDFSQLCPPEIQPPHELVKIYQALKDDEVSRVLALGEKLLQTDFKDRLAIIQPMYHAIKSINSDLDEHGEMNLMLYDGGKHTISYYKDYEKKIKKLLDKTKASGATSNVYAEVMDTKARDDVMK
jgi:tetratricopeptide (TPR) repeat protein